MLTIHDYTFVIDWRGWGPQTHYAERAAQATMLRLLEMSPEEIARLAKSQRALIAMSLGARLSLIQLLTRKDKPVPYKGVIELGVFECLK